MEETHKKTALIIGGSMAGLLAARVLSDYYQEVIIIERDVFADGPAPRKGVPQAHQPHVFLLRGLKILEVLFPGISDELVETGASYSNGDDWCFMTHVGMPVRVNLGYIIGATRGMLEWHVRCRVAKLPNIRFLTGVEVVALIGNENQSGITGVQLHDRHAKTENNSITADLIVDASGRYSKTPAWLAALGYPTPSEDVVNAGVGYSSRIYRKPDHFPATWQNALVQPHPPYNARVGVLLSVEGNRWHVMMGGTAKEYPPTDNEGFLDWARSLTDPCIYEAIRLCEPLTPIRSFRIPETHFRHYERLSHWPEGFIIVGDAVCAFNPFYGQGVTVAAMEAEALSALLQQKMEPGWEKRFQQKVAKVASEAWRIGTGEDLRWGSVQINGKPADLATRLLHHYMDMLLSAACTDATLSRAFFKVIQMLKPSATLMYPTVMLRVLWHILRGRKVPEESQHALSPDILSALQMRINDTIKFSQTD